MMNVLKVMGIMLLWAVVGGYGFSKLAKYLEIWFDVSSLVRGYAIGLYFELIIYEYFKYRKKKSNETMGDELKEIEPFWKQQRWLLIVFMVISLLFIILGKWNAPSAVVGGIVSSVFAAAGICWESRQSLLQRKSKGDT